MRKIDKETRLARMGQGQWLTVLPPMRLSLPAFWKETIEEEMDITMSGGTGHLSINYKHKYTIQKKLDLQLLTKNENSLCSHFTNSL